MAHLNKVMLIGRLTRDPDPARTLANGGKVVNFSFAVGRSRKNPQTGQWENDPNPMFIDCEIYNRREGAQQMADIAERYFVKGKQLFLEGQLKLDQWDDKTTGAKRSKHKLTVESFQMLDSPAGQGSEGEYGAPRGNAVARGPAPASRPATNYYPADADDEPAAPSGNAGGDDDIPF